MLRSVRRRWRLANDAIAVSPLMLALHTGDAASDYACAAFARQQGWAFRFMPSPLTNSRQWQISVADIAVVVSDSAQLASTVAALSPMPPDRSLIILLRDGDAVWRATAMLAGADDVQPADIDCAELHARLFALARRRAQARGILWCDELAIDLVGREVRRDGQLIRMPMREFGLIARLAMSPNQPVSRSDLLRAVWRIDFDPGTNRIDVHVSRLRRRVDDGHSHAMLRTVKGMGYALVSRDGAAAFS